MLTVLTSRQRTLEQLYRRRAVLEKTITSLEIYAESAGGAAAKVVSLQRFPPDFARTSSGTGFRPS